MLENEKALYELYERWGFDKSTYSAAPEYFSFRDPSLADYLFRSDLNDAENMLGYDRNGCCFDSEGKGLWGENLIQARLSGIIAHEFPVKTVFVQPGILLGRICSAPDGTYRSATCYYTSNYFDISGFASEFYAVRSLVSLSNISFHNQQLKLPDAEFPTTSADACEEVGFGEFHIPLGFVQNCHQMGWLATSFYGPKEHSEIELHGFATRFYAEECLLKLASLFSPDEFENQVEHLWRRAI